MFYPDWPNCSGTVTNKASFNAVDQSVMDIQIIPNPTNNETKISFDLQESGNLSVILVDISGQALMNIHNAFSKAGKFTTAFSVGALPAGVYYLKITHNGNTKVEKIVKN